MKNVILAVPLLVGCGGNICDGAAITAVPADGAGPVTRDTVITANFSGDPETVTITATADDTAIAGTTTIDGSTATFTPSEPLPENADVTYTASVCEAQQVGTFTTGQLDSRIEPDSLENKTWALDLENATWVSPAGAGPLIGAYFGGAFLIGVEDASDTEITCIGAAGQATESESWQQDPCFPTVDFPAVDFTSNPYLHLTAPELRFEVQGITAIMYNVEITGGLTDEAVVDGAFAGEVDLRDYSDLGIDCGLLEQFLGTGCTACTSDGDASCLQLEAVDVQGTRIQGLTLVRNTDPQECDTSDTAH